ncbi:hypothetical protein [Tenacibaculum sp. 190524A05c]|uniref:SGNH/GDSL hydrolase family protein n=1 Tax=Tenacibaculum platacis TaxID=3137852 RepID=UPI0031FB0670
MKLFKYAFGILLMLTVTVLFKGCSSQSLTPTMPPNPNENPGKKIMPLGASRVAGAQPEYYSYRYDLWKLLVEGGFQFDFVGVVEDENSYPDVNGKKFDPDHEGRGGINSGGILSEIKSTLNTLTTPPDIVLFSSPGGNDGGLENFQSSLQNINAIIDEFQAKNSNVIIYLELPAPTLTSEQTPEFLTLYNKAIEEFKKIAEQQTTSSSKVLTIDMTANVGFNDSFLADDVHYNQEGAKFIAKRYFDTIKTMLN